MKVTVWSTPNCVQCAQTKKQFDKLGIRYDEMALDQHPDKLEEFKAKGLLQAPIVTTDTKVWSGFRIDKIQSLAAHLKSLGVVDKVEPYIAVDSMQEFYREQGEQREQERIIKLLSDNYWHHIEAEPVYFMKGSPQMLEPKYRHAEGCMGCQVIAHVKGESK